ALWPHQIEGIKQALENNYHALELPTGEGKTFIVGAVALWHALNKKQVHVTTANTYLADRDLDWLAPLYRHYEISYVRQNSPYAEKILQSEQSAIVYGTITEF